MTREEALALLPPHGEETDEPVILSRKALPLLSAADLWEGVLIGVGDLKDNAYVIDWDGHLYRKDGGLHAYCQFIWTRKYWDSPLGMPQYLDLVKRSIETRQRLRGDVEFIDWDDDGAYIHLSFALHGLPEALVDANDYVIAQIEKLEEAAREAAERSGVIAAEIAQRVSGWGATPLDKLVEVVECAKSSDEKGRSLEELVARIFAGVPGFTVSGRVRTETEEIDITIVNGSDDHRLKREEAMILVECKNWSGKCGKNEFVAFKEKIENRRGRCSLGFIVSWNGFTGTVTKEMLRGSRERALIVPVSGAEIREAARSGRYLDAIAAAWSDAINT